MNPKSGNSNLGGVKTGAPKVGIPKHSNPKTALRRAQAPYNFVPLPQQVVTIEAPPPQDQYTGFTGVADVELITRSPLYIRGMLREAQHIAIGQKEPDDVTPADKELQAPFFAVNTGVPCIPGSSLRGMMRSIVEIAGFGKLHWVADRPTVNYRAVAADRDDPLAAPYRNILGKFGRNVGAGYLHRLRSKEDGEDTWVIRPARQPREQGWPEQNAYLKVRQEVALDSQISGLQRMGEAGYKPGYCTVYFNAEIRSGQRGAHLAVSELGIEASGRSYKGALVWSGDMAETLREGGSIRKQNKAKSPRRNHALVLEAKPGAPPLPIPRRALEDYRRSMTKFQAEEVWHGDFPQEGRPLFYIEQEGLIVAFGHSPNFRIPAFVEGSLTAATPQTFAPRQLRDAMKLDLAEAIFGWTPEGQRTSSCAGRVFFEDAHLAEPIENPWYSEQPITPQILGSPKPTTFQHYLVQDAQRSHDPDDRSQLAHYATSPQETVIRGHKRYWFKGASPEIRARFADEHEQTRKEKQLTRIQPVRAGVRFHFRVRFENLRSEELGALLWALQLPGQEGRRYYHALGMGKPLGMGAVEMQNLVLHLSDRQARYRSLFAAAAGGALAGQPGAGGEAPTTVVHWLENATTAPDSFIKQFESFVLQQVARGTSATHLHQLERIRNLLVMLEWRGERPDRTWLELTRYLEIEHNRNGQGNATEDEYKSDRVLPTPLGVVEAWRELRQTTTTPDVTQSKTQPASNDVTKVATPKQILDKADDYQEGVVTRFLAERRFGFIKPKNGDKDVFVHQDRVQKGVILSPGDKVIFRIRRGPKGDVAEDVKLKEGQ